MEMLFSLHGSSFELFLEFTERRFLLNTTFHAPMGGFKLESKLEPSSRSINYVCSCTPFVVLTTSSAGRVGCRPTAQVQHPTTPAEAKDLQLIEWEDSET